MSEIARLEIEGRIIEHVVLDGGMTAYPATEIAESLGFANPHEAIRDHVDEKDLAFRSVLTTGGKQRKKFITGVGVQVLTFRSNLPKAREYTRKVAEHMEAVRAGEVAIVPLNLSRTRATLLAHAEMARIVSAVPGVRSDVIAAVHLDAIGRDLGVNPEPYRRALPARIETPAGLNATAVGALIEVSGIKANKLLEQAGFQVKNVSGDWELTPSGQAFGEARPFHRNGHSGFQIEWKPEVADKLLPVSPARGEAR